MYKFLFILMFFINTLLGNTINFKEIKYISVLDMEINKTGQIELEEEYIKLLYPEEKKSFSFYKDIIIFEKDEVKKELTYEDSPQLKLFYLLIKAIYKNNINSINEYFEIEEQKDFTKLIPNDSLSNYVHQIDLKKEKNYLVFLKLYFTNDDRIEIFETK